MTILVDWPAAAVLAAGLTVLLGLAWLLRGGRAALRMSGAVGIADILVGLAIGKIAAVAAGVIILAVVCWCLWGEREPRRSRTSGRA